MKLTISTSKLSQHPRNVIRSCGYGEIYDKRSGHTSYVRRVSSYHYPRFHVYITFEQDKVIFDMHLDETPSVRKGQKAHNAQYDSPLVKHEMHRIADILRKQIPQASSKEDKDISALPQQTIKKPSFWQKWFKRKDKHVESA